ncbi:MAG: ElaA protein [Saprospiraceae bacterium]|nr:MAG: ElaA protein [Saprospiraceae bacterium]
MQINFQCLSFDELTNEQLYRIMVLRQRVFVVEQECAYLDADDKDQKSWHLLGYDQQKNLVAYARLLPIKLSYPGYASIGRVVNAPEVRGRGVGQQLMIEAITFMEQLFPGTPIKISAQVYLIQFYESLGFQITGTEYLEDDIPHISMVKK